MIDNLQKGPDDVVTKGHKVLTRHARCLFCGNLFEEDDEISLMPTSPASEEDAAKYQRGEDFQAHCGPVHWACVLRRWISLAVWRPWCSFGQVDKYRGRAEA